MTGSTWIPPAELIHGGLGVVDVQRLHGLGHKVGGVDLGGIDGGAVQGTALGGPLPGVLDHRNGGILLDVQLGDQEKGRPRQDRKAGDQAAVFFQVTKDIQLLHGATS